MGSSFSIAIRFRVRERKSSARLKAGRRLWALGFWLWASRRSQGRFVGQDWKPLIRRSVARRLPDERSKLRATAPLSHGTWQRIASFDRRSVRSHANLAPLTSLRRCARQPPPPANRRSLERTALPLSKKRRERARCLASTSANDGCLVHPWSRFESRRERGLPFGRLASRPVRRKRRAEIVERSG